MPVVNIRELLEEKLPWLVKDFNGATWESKQEQMRRELNAVVAHMDSLEERYASLENRLNVHSKGVDHRAPKIKE